MNTNKKDTQSSVLQRIRQIIERYSVSDRRFAEAINLPQTTISSLFNRGNEPNVSILQSILNVYTAISPEWLLTGEGSMFKADIATDKSQIVDTDIWERFEEFAIKCYPNYVENSQIMCEALNIDKSRLKEILIDGAFLSYSEILNLSYSGINLDWLLTGEGSMLKSEVKDNAVVVAQEEGTPLLPVEAWGGSLSGSSIAILAEQCKKYNVPISNIDYLIPIAGDSMMPDYCPGDVVAIKKVNERAFIEWGKVYVLDTCNGVVIKEVQPSENDGCITCISRNAPTKYKPFEINLCPEVFYGMYAVKGTVRIS